MKDIDKFSNFIREFNHKAPEAETKFDNFIATIANINDQDAGQKRAVHIVCDMGLPVTYLQKLALRGADLNCSTFTGYTPLHFAARGGLKDLVDFLLENGAEKSSNNNLIQPMHLAAQSNNVETLKKIIEGLEADQLNNTTYLPVLHIAIGTQNPQMVAAILDTPGVDINITSPVDNKTALVKAADIAVPQIIKMISNKGANLNAIDNEGKTALHYAALNHDSETVEFLLAKGANPDIADDLGQTAKDILHSYELPKYNSLLELPEDKVATNSKKPKVPDYLDEAVELMRKVSALGMYEVEGAKREKPKKNSVAPVTLKGQSNLPSEKGRGAES